MSSYHSKDLLRQYVKALMLELRISRRGRKTLDLMKGAWGDLWRGDSKDSSSAKTYLNDEEPDIKTELNRWFRQIQRISRKKISPSKVQEIKNFVEDTYRNLLDKGEDERSAVVKTIRAVDKKYASDV